MWRKTQFNTLCCYSEVQRSADYDATDMCCSMKTEVREKFPFTHISTCFDWYVRVKSRQQFALSIMCKKNKGHAFNTAALPFYSISLEVPTVALISVSAEEISQEAVTDLNKILQCIFLCWVHHQCVQQIS